MGTSDMAENIDKSINLSEYLVIDTTYNELNENINIDAEEDPEVSTDNAAKTVSDMVQNPLAADGSEEVNTADVPTENAAQTNSDMDQNTLAKDSETGVQIKVEEFFEDEDVQYVQTIHRDVVQETIDLDTLVDKDVAFVRETVPKQLTHGWPKDTAAVQRIMSFRNTIFASIVDLLFQDREYIWIDRPLSGAARHYVYNTLCKINRGKIFYTDNDKQQEYLMYILEFMKHYNFYLDYAIKSRGFSIFRNYTKKTPRRPKKKHIKCNVKCEPRTPTNSAVSDNTNLNNVRVKVERE